MLHAMLPKKEQTKCTYFLKSFFFLITFKKVLTQHCKSAVCAELLSCVWLFATPWTVAHQAPLSLVILQARILEWVAMPTSRGSSQPRDQTQDSCIAGGVFTIWEISYTSIKKKTPSLSNKQKAAERDVLACILKVWLYVIHLSP